MTAQALLRSDRKRLGATGMSDGSCRFEVWAPAATRVAVRLLDRDREVALEPAADGYHGSVVDDVPPGSRYRYVVDGRDLPDPASRWQPQGVAGPSAVLRPYRWTDGGWSGIPLERFVVYEFHVGTFTPEGTFDAAVGRLDDLVDLGITAVELMPVAQFPGDRNWGYDGVFPFAAQDTYGGPDGLRGLVDACHARGLAVILDVVYNHLGPEGNVLDAWGPYFTDRYVTPWGRAMNFDGPGADEVRRYFVENALHWLEGFHVDALRLDAIHGIVDTSAYPFLEQLAHAVRGLPGHPRFLIAESDLNDPRVITPPDRGGLGLDAQWNDDFHHALHAVLTGERAGYYGDFGSVEDLAAAMGQGFVLDGRRSGYRGRRHGRSSAHLPPERFVVFSQNHDQVGNRMAGERLSALVPLESLKLAAGAVLLAPALPLLFMGEEYGETAPFLYFVSHTDPDLIESVRRGRAEEFAGFRWAGQPPDPQAEDTFLRSKLDPGLAGREPHRSLRSFYRELLGVRRSHPALAVPTRDGLEVVTEDRALVLLRRRGDEAALAVFNFSDEPATVRVPDGAWRLLLDSSEPRWAGSGPSAPDRPGRGEVVTVAPRALALYGADR